MSDKAIITCALTGVLTDPAALPVPVTPEEMAQEAKRAYDAGAAVMHVHFRRQEPGRGHESSWEPSVARAICDAIRDACPRVLINMSTGVIGEDLSGPLACLRELKPEVAACNAGTLNYLKVRRDGQWAWPPLVFDNPVEKVSAFLEVMAETHTRPELECFDTGIVRAVGLYRRAGMIADLPLINFVMGVASGMPADPRLLELVLDYRVAGAPWQVTAIGRQEVWPLHRRAAELGGNLRSGVEDTFYLPDGARCRGNGDLIAELVRLARETGREIASCEEACAALGVSSRTT